MAAAKGRPPDATRMTSPRKFAEKIALHNQKQAEGTAEFEQVMRDVHKATKVRSRVRSRRSRALARPSASEREGTPWNVGAGQCVFITCHNSAAPCGGGARPPEIQTRQIIRQFFA